MIRLATAADALAIQSIYAPFVAASPVSFETVVPSAEEMVARIEATLAHFPWLVEDDGQVRGYAYASRHRDRLAYRWSVDVTAYVAEGGRRKGTARRLYDALFRLLVFQGFVTAYAGITLPNPASVGLHEAMGFRHIGTYTGVGFKDGAWRDVGWWQLKLMPAPAKPREPINFADLARDQPETIAAILFG